LTRARCFLVAAVVVARVSVAPPVRAQAAGELRVSLPVDLSITAGATAVWIASDAFKSDLAPLACRWCGANGLDTAVRDQLRWTTNAGVAVTLSNGGAYVVAPLVSAGILAVSAAQHGGARQMGVDLLITAQAVALAADLNQLVKYTVGRQRPYAHAGVPNPDTRQGADDANLSFYSAHTSVTFSLAFAAGTVARLRGYRWAPVIFIAGASIGALTAYLRIAADQHYLTDVVAGASIGSAVGIAVPYFFHRPRSGAGATAPSFALTPVAIAGGRGVGCTMIW
jgi:membrane-associated phospholipid phosphatase